VALTMKRNETTARRWKTAALVTVVLCAAMAGPAYFLFVDRGPFIGLWLTPDQQGRWYFERGNYVTASDRFQDPLWKGIAFYRAGNFGAAVEQFARVDTAQGYFNLGDAYARAGRLEQAVAGYDEALRRKADYREARENRDLLQAILDNKQKRKQKDDEPPPGQDPHYAADEIKFDEKGKKGKEGLVEQAELTTEQIQELWMRRLQTTPSDFLRMKFAAQVDESTASKTAGKAGEGRQ
jgi:Ca-activated chloride channel homolog